MRKSTVYLVPCLLVTQTVLADYLLTSGSGDTGTNGGQSITRYTNAFAVVWERSAAAGTAETGVFSVEINPVNGDIYTGNITSPQLGKHLSYADGSTVGRPIPQGAQADGTGKYTPPSEAIQDLQFGYDYNNDGIADLWVCRRDTFEVYDGTTLDRTGDNGTADLLTSLKIADSGGSSGIQDGTGGFGITFGPDVTGDGVGELYAMAVVNANTGSRLSVWNPVTMTKVATYSIDGTKDNTLVILGPDVNGDGRQDLWINDPRNHRIRAYDYTTGALVAGSIALVKAGDPGTTVTLRFPTDIECGPDGTILVTTRFATSLDPHWAGSVDTAGGNLLQIKWDPTLAKGLVTLLYESNKRVDAVAYIAPELRNANEPYPAKGASDVPKDTVLTWKAGQSAVAHNLYLGTSADAIEAATSTDPLGVLVASDLASPRFAPASPLTFGQTYFWRVDEVNAAPDSSVFKGNVWDFTVEPTGYPITTAIVATASSSSTAQMGPENTVNGSGLNAANQHSTTAAQMWLSSKAAGQPIWIQYEFDRVYKLHRMWVWNSNQAVEPDVGLGAKDVTIETSADGVTWMTLAGVPVFAQATGDATYVQNTTVELGGVFARFVKLTIATNWGDGTKQAGLSEVRFFYDPVKAFSPKPASGAKDVAPDAVLSWRPGREAARHEVLFGLDANAVAAGTVPVQITQEHSLDLGPLGLEYGRTYSWKVNEVNDAATTRVWEGDVWTFSTRDYAIVEDFESYDDLCNRIFFAWVDGFGYSAAPDCGVAASGGNGTGSTVGKVAPPFAERTIVHSGRQSMPMVYDNTASKSTSEASHTFAAAQDWTRGGLKTLVLYFQGDSNNTTGQLYVKINGTRVDYTGSTDALTKAQWKQWSIDLTSVAGDLRGVKTLDVGVSGAGKGILYIDDSRLYRVAPAE